MDVELLTEEVEVVVARALNLDHFRPILKRQKESSEMVSKNN